MLLYVLDLLCRVGLSYISCHRFLMYVLEAPVVQSLFRSGLIPSSFGVEHPHVNVFVTRVSIYGADT